MIKHLREISNFIIYHIFNAKYESAEIFTRGGM